MKASELVKLLNEAIEEHGDLEVATWVDTYSAPAEIGKPQLEEMNGFKYLEI